MNNNKIIIYGGTSYISRELLKILSKKFSKFIIFCRNQEIVKKYIEEINNEKIKFEIYEVDILNLKKNYELIENLDKDIQGLIWLAGYTGDAEIEFQDNQKCEENIRINFLNPVLIINKIIEKIIPHESSFVVGVASVAGLRGRKKRLYYSSAKSGLIAYLSGLRQKLNSKKINVISVIPGYIKTKPFNIKSSPVLISSPKRTAEIINKSIFSKKEIVYVNYLWKIIMIFINFIPEKIFKKLNF